MSYCTQSRGPNVGLIVLFVLFFFYFFLVFFTDITKKISIIFISLLFSTINQIFTLLNPNPSKKVLNSKSPSPNPKPTTGTLICKFLKFS